MIISIEAMHLLPRPFDVTGAPSSSQGRLWNDSTPPPSCRSVFYESLPHLLPRQAFSFWPIALPDRAKNDGLRSIAWMMASSSPEILLSIPNSLRALAGLTSPRTRTDKHVDTKLVVQLCNRMDTAAAGQAGQDRLPQ
ncbi:hypothetical protein GFL54_11800 [Rhizobium laguerreae]|nr:hypothetical protein [Rhizobium laguerreae]